MTYLPRNPDLLLEFNKNLVGLNSYYSSDTEELYQTNRRSLSSRWLWYDSDIQYYINSLGYRMCEFEDLRWDRYYSVFGCSHTVGVGMPVAQLWWDQIGRELDLDVVNAAVSGGGCELVLYNLAQQLSSSVTLPKFVVIQWPNPRRKMTVNSLTNEVLRFLPNGPTAFEHSLQQRWYEYLLTQEAHWQLEFYQTRLAAQALCRLAGVPLFEFSFEPELQQWGMRTIYLFPLEEQPRQRFTSLPSYTWLNQMARDLQRLGDQVWAHPGSYAQNQILDLIRPWLVEQQLA